MRYIKHGLTTIEVNALTKAAALWHHIKMDESRYQLTPKLLDSLYTEAMVLADEVRFYFDHERVSSTVPTRIAVAFSCESLKVTTRLMHVIAWLLHQKAVRNGEMAGDAHHDRNAELGYAPASDDFSLPHFPEEAQAIIGASEDLYYRLQRIDNRMRKQQFSHPVPHDLVNRIRAAF
jgi:regulator of CtrA degradation